MYQKWLFYLLILNVSVKSILASTFDNDLYERVLDPELCDIQLRSILNSEFLIQFYDAGVRAPRGLLSLNLNDWGSYHACLGISNGTEVDALEGKYCRVSVPIRLNLTSPTWTETSDSLEVNVNEEVLEEMLAFEKIKRNAQFLIDGRSAEDHPSLSTLNINLGICVPKTCTAEEAFEFFTLNLTPENYTVTEQYCRLPNDKPFAPADYVAFAFFSIIGLLLLLSTAYDLYQTIVLKRESKEISKLLSSFSVYTNSKRLLSFSFSRDALHCLDGIRAIAMLWVIYGHVMGNYVMTTTNPRDLLEWTISWTGTTVLMSAPITVDTFFMMSGLLLVYTMAGKLSQKLFLTRLHMFYILRYLRFFPILAAAVLMQASIFHHIADGPLWNQLVAPSVHLCRENWWATFLYVANYIDIPGICLGVTWYMMVEMQLFWISPLVLVWVLSNNKRTAWLGLGIGLFLSLVSVSVYCFVYNFPSSFFKIGEDSPDYFKLYYINTLTRGSPFFVGMVIGYILHLWRGKKVRIPIIYVLILWALTFGGFSFIIFITNHIVQPGYENQILDNFLNAYSRGIWSAALGWMIIACVHGYGGPINWFLSLNIWKLPARLSYAMYLFHMPIMQAVAGSFVVPIYFSGMRFMYRFMADTLLTYFWSFIITLAVDSPFSTLQKLAFGESFKNSKKPPPKIEITKHEMENGNQIKTEVKKL